MTALVKALPKDLRRNFVPAPDHARAALRGMQEAGDRWGCSPWGRRWPRS